MKAMVRVAVFFVAVAGGAQAQSRLPPPPADIAELRLPEGELLPVSQSGRGAFFLETDSVRRTGRTVDYRVLEIYQPGVKTAYGVAVETVARFTLDCDRRTRGALGALAFDEAGRLVMWLPVDAAERIEAGSAADYQARVLCDGRTPPSGPVRGHAAALAAARAVAGAAR